MPDSLIELVFYIMALLPIRLRRLPIINLLQYYYELMNLSAFDGLGFIAMSTYTVASFDITLLSL